jgi:hypothetical protein
MPSDMVDVVNNAAARAGPSDAGWNRRFVDALEAMGFQVVPENNLDMFTPIPWHEGWQYTYPSVIVKKIMTGVKDADT